jgi:HD domain-containing protein
MLTGRRPLLPFLEVIRQHHERFDGHGYPDGLAGEEISLAARIVAVVDVWDALTSDRAYRPAWPPNRASSVRRREPSPARTDGVINGPRCPRGWSQPVAIRGAYNTRRSAVSPWRQAGLPGGVNAGAADLDLVRMTTPGLVP